MEKITIKQLYQEAEQELQRILEFWSQKMPDETFGGFRGELDFEGNAVINAPKGIILNTRILWSFSAAGIKTGNANFREMADRAYNYLIDHFVDKDFGGVFWLIDHRGELLNSRKQIYAQAFFIYALAEYYKLCQKQEALDLALSLFRLIEEKASDKTYGGYIDAFDQEWNELEDMSLSEKDINEKKILNTHLHILEAYTNLYRIYPETELKSALENSIRLFLKYFIGADFHLNMFFDQFWNIKSQLVSYGHDIEASWLLYEAAEVLADEDLKNQVAEISVKMADKFLKEAVCNDGGIHNETNKSTGHLDTDRHWWPQAEAIIGLLNAGQITGKSEYLEQSVKIWNYTKAHFFDYENGEWHWKVDESGIPDSTMMKAGFWKCPYHNTRGCLEIMNRISI